MSNYQKIWGTAFGLITLVIFGLLIYSGTTSENSGSVLQTINSLDTKKVRDIVIAPENPKWKINLTIDTLTVTNKNKVNDIIFALKGLTEKHVTKGAKRFWESNLIINLDNSYITNLKDKDRFAFKVYDTQEGLFIETTNTMGYKTSACQRLKPLLERLTNFQTALGGQN